jgi:hypothetical protein
MHIEAEGISNRAILDQPVQRLGFNSFKTIRPIPYTARWHRDLLIQATFDPVIDEIDYASKPIGDRDCLALRLIVEGSPLLVMAARGTDGVSSQFLPTDGLILDRSFVLREPRASDARALWATRKLMVQIGDRLRILLAVADGLEHRIADLVPCIRDRGYDPFEAILSLVCRGDLAIDLRDGLHPDARIAQSKRRVRARPSDDQLGAAYPGLTRR